MGTKKIISGILILVVLGTIAAFISSPPIIQTQRGRVIPSSGQSSIKPDGYQIIKASFLSFEMAEDSTKVISGDICLLDENDKPTGNKLPFQPRRFPIWFKFGCEEEGDFVDYKLVANGTKAVITHFPKRND